MRQSLFRLLVAIFAALVLVVTVAPDVQAGPFQRMRDRRASSSCGSAASTAQASGCGSVAQAASGCGSSSAAQFSPTFPNVTALPAGITTFVDASGNVWQLVPQMRTTPKLP